VMSNALTKLVTLDGNGAETINGALTRVMWANEWCLLYCDGTLWYKEAGLSIPMQAKIYRDTTQSGINSATLYTSISLPTNLYDIGGIADTANSCIRPRRVGKYECSGQVKLEGGHVVPRWVGYIFLNGATSTVALSEQGVTNTGTYGTLNFTGPGLFSPGDIVTVGCYQDSGVTKTLFSVNANNINFLSVQEIISW
jgi:hypothetical protein